MLCGPKYFYHQPQKALHEALERGNTKIAVDVINEVLHRLRDAGKHIIYDGKAITGVGLSKTLPSSLSGSMFLIYDTELRKGFVVSIFSTEFDDFVASMLSLFDTLPVEPLFLVEELNAAWKAYIAERLVFPGGIITNTLETFIDDMREYLTSLSIPVIYLDGEYGVAYYW